MAVYETPNVMLLPIIRLNIAILRALGDPKYYPLLELLVKVESEQPKINVPTSLLASFIRKVKEELEEVKIEEVKKKLGSNFQKNMRRKVNNIPKMLLKLESLAPLKEHCDTKDIKKYSRAFEEFFKIFLLICNHLKDIDMKNITYEKLYCDFVYFATAPDKYKKICKEKS